MAFEIRDIQFVTEFPWFLGHPVLHVIKNNKTIKGTVNVISSGPPYKDDNTRFITVSLKTFI